MLALVLSHLCLYSGAKAFIVFCLTFQLSFKRRFQSRVAPTLGTLQHYISTSSTNTQDQASSNSTSAVAAATSLRTPTVAAGCAGSSSTAAIATMAVPTVAPQQSAIAASTAYTAVAYNPTSSKTSTTGTDKQKPNSDAFEESSQRLVYMAKYVYAVQRGNSSSGSGEGRREHDLGVAVFGRINEETQFVSVLWGMIISVFALHDQI